MFSQNLTLATLALLLVAFTFSCKAQSDYDDDGYNNQPGNNQGGYGNDDSSYANDDSYNGNQPNYNQNVDSEGSNNNPSNYQPQGGSDADGDYEGDDGTAASAVVPTIVRLKRSTEEAKAASKELPVAESKSLSRVKRHGKYYIGPVYTYVKTDKHANFKWGVKHKVGKKHYG